MNHFRTLAACAVAVLLGGPVYSEPAQGDENAAARAKTFTVASGSVGGVVRLGGSVEPEQIVNLSLIHI